MRSLILIACLVATPTAALTNCHTDTFGHTHCYGSSSNLNAHSDHFGNTTILDNRGHVTHCHTDNFGNTSCY